MEGVMAGKDMLEFVNLAKTAVERHDALLAWIQSWTGDPEMRPLSLEGWFEEGHGITGGKKDRGGKGVWMPTHCPAGRTFLWAPPPAAADAALEELLKACHKRTDLRHVVVIPRLMLPRWRRLFNKACDFTFEVSPGQTFWPDSMFEPLWVGVALPFTHHRPWSLKRAPALVGMGIKLRKVLPASEIAGRDILRKLWNLPRVISRLPEGLARRVLRVPWAGYLPATKDRRRGWQSLAQGSQADT